MGKPTGFLEYERKQNISLSPEERIADFNEFHPQLEMKERQEQGARCMNCGIPFCQSAVAFGNGPGISGCPLHNLIPEWNDLLYNGHLDYAADRLLKTNNFPEFTGRVCPALCEAACTCGLNGDAVTCRENELAIIETAYNTGQIKPNVPKVRTENQIAVVGSGPAGLAVADMLNKRGHHVTVYERDDRLGGLLMYGIPNMKLEKQIVDRKITILKQEGIKFITKFNVDASNADELVENYDAVILCCGAKKARSLGMNELEVKGVYNAVDFLTETTRTLLNKKYDLEAFSRDRKHPSAKGKNVVIVGGGDTGNDCVGTCIREGAKSVIQLEMMPEPPEKRLESNPWPEWPNVLKTDYGQEEAITVYGSDPRIYQTTVKEIHKDKNNKIKSITIVNLEFKKDSKTGRMIPETVPGSEKKIDCDLLIIAAGFVGAEDYTPKAFGVEVTPKNTVSTEDGSYKTSADKVFTAGDMHRGQSLVVWAISEGRACAKEVDEYLMGYSYMSE